MSIKLVTPPTHCSSCFGQNIERQHVDFDAAWDGPVFRDGVATGGSGEESNVIPVAIDDLIICDECLRQAAGLLGLVDPDETTERLGEALGQLENLRDRLAEREDYVSKLEAAVKAKVPNPVAA